MRQLSDRLARIVDAVEKELREVSEKDSQEAILPGKWSRKQILGHLIDSASNNHQRFVRAALQDSLEFPGYNQGDCVEVQAIAKADWQTLVALWASYNRYLAHVVAHLPAAKLEVPCRIGSNGPVTLEWLAQDYVRHLVHRLDQMGLPAPQ
jgi:hypothetical protein